MSPRAVRIWLVGLLPLLAIVVVVAVALLRSAGSGAGPVDQAVPGTVLLVAGYGGSTASLDVLARHLRDGGRDVEIVPPVGDNTGGLREQAQALDRVARLAVADGAPSVDVVGYSAGGVVARVWATELGGAGVARRIVTLGSPHHGTDVAQLAAGLLPGSCPTACQELRPGSDLLSGTPETVRGPAWTSIWTADDDLVLPPSSAVLRGAVNVQLQAVCPDDAVRHGGLPRDPLAVGLVELALAPAALPSAPSPTRCSALRAAGS